MTSFGLLLFWCAPKAVKQNELPPTSNKVPAALLDRGAHLLLKNALTIQVIHFLRLKSILTLVDPRIVQPNVFERERGSDDGATSRRAAYYNLSFIPS